MQIILPVLGSKSTRYLSLQAGLQSTRIFFAARHVLSLSVVLVNDLDGVLELLASSRSGSNMSDSRSLSVSLGVALLLRRKNCP